MNILSSLPRALAALGLALILGAAAPAPIPAPASKALPPSITLAQARMVIEGATAYARERNVLMAVCVVDQAGDVISCDRMDGVSFANTTYAQGKAFASAISRQTTETLSQLAKDRPDRYFGIMNMYPGKVYLVGGGVPIIRNGQFLGAVGTAGLAQYEDEAAGRAGIAVLERSGAAR
jgi:uncharacterized protein GlcG (DUF336 family)